MTIQAKVVKVVGPLETVPISKSSIHRGQRKERGRQVQQLMKKFESIRPLHSCGHWDSKLVSSLTGKQNK